jgi:5'-nucleotidase
MTRRRDFLRTSSIAATALLFSKPLQNIAGISYKNKYLNKEINTLRIFHTNNLRGQLGCYNDGIGGLQNVINTLNQYDESIVLDAGDFLDAKLTLHQQKEIINIMNTACYKAATIGNHDIANGQQYLAEIIPAMKFPLVNCNYQFSNDDLRNLVKPYAISKYGRFKIGITGVGINLNNKLKRKEKIVCSHPYSANTVATYLREVQNCDLVICLSHLEHEKKTSVLNNFDFAVNSKNIDVIIGGHGRTMNISPLITRNKVKEEVFVSQTGWKGTMLRKLEFSYNEYGKNGFSVKNFIPGLAQNTDVFNHFKEIII